MSNNQGGDWTEQPTYAMPPSGAPQQGNPAGQNNGQPGGYQQPYQSAPPQQGGAPQGQQGWQGQQPYQSQPPQQQNAFGQPGWQQNSQQGFGQSGFGASSLSGSGAGGIGKMMGWAIVGTSLLAVLGCFGSWASVKFSGGMLGSVNSSANGLGMSSSSSGTTSSSSWGDSSIHAGWFILLPALVAVAIGVLRALGKLPRVAAFGATAMGVIGACVGMYKWNDIHSKLVDAKDAMSGSMSSGATFEGSVGWGLMLAVIACLALIVVSAVSAVKD